MTEDHGSALHDRLIGRPAKAVGLIKFLDHARKRDRVWFCTGRDIAEHWCRGASSVRHVITAARPQNPVSVGT